jgi:hypothetical protein
MAEGICNGRWLQGIKVKDAESKRKVKEVLAAEESMREMMVDDAGPKKQRPNPSDGMVMG